MNRRAPALLPVLLAAGCATGRLSAREPVVVAEPPNARVKLYADCVGASAQAGTYQRYGRYIWYTCRGAAAQALFDESETLGQGAGKSRVQPARPSGLFDI